VFYLPVSVSIVDLYSA